MTKLLVNIGSFFLLLIGSVWAEDPTPTDMEEWIQTGQLSALSLRTLDESRKHLQLEGLVSQVTLPWGEDTIQVEILEDSEPILSFHLNDTASMDRVQIFNFHSDHPEKGSAILAHWVFSRYEMLKKVENAETNLKRLYTHYLKHKRLLKLIFKKQLYYNIIYLPHADWEEKPVMVSGLEREGFGANSETQHEEIRAHRESLSYDTENSKAELLTLGKEGIAVYSTEHGWLTTAVGSSGIGPTLSWSNGEPLLLFYKPTSITNDDHWETHLSLYGDVAALMAPESPHVRIGFSSSDKSSLTIPLSPSFAQDCRSTLAKAAL